MKTMHIHATAAIAAALFAFGCTESIDSKNIKTAGIAALIDATSTNGTATTVLVELKTGGAQSNTYVDLSDGDALSVEVDGKTYEMSAEGNGYEAEIPTGAADTEFKVSFQRRNDTSAPDSKGQMPAPFTLDDIPTGDHSRAEDLVITWDAASASASEMSIQLDGNCIFVETFEVPDSGTYTVRGGELKATSDDMPKSCVVEVELRRTRKGTADVGYDSESWFRLHQVRTTSFTSAP
jgi:hypothetical protein